MPAPTRTRERLEAVIGARFTITRELGGGGMSETFVAHDRQLGRDIVIKVIAPSLADGVNLERFTREIALGAALQHPNLVPVLDAGVVDELPYFTMPFVAGDSLRRRLTGAPMTVAESIPILRDVARGLGAAHARGVVHRDVKPDNVLLTGDAAVVTDLGIAKALASSGKSTTLTRTGLSLGTPAYFAPEQATGDAIDARADWYAFGVMAFEMLTGRLPFIAPTDAGLLVAHVTVPPPDISRLRPDLPSSLAALVMRCLAKEPTERPASTDEVVQALDRSLSAGDTMTPVSSIGGGTPSAASVATPTAGAAHGRSRRFALGISAGVLATALVGGVWWSQRAPAGESAGESAAPSPDAPRRLWLAMQATADTAQAARIRDALQELRVRIPGAAGVELVPNDTVLADTVAAAALARARQAVVVVVSETSTAGGPASHWSTIFTPTGEGSCQLEALATGADSVARRDLLERVLGTLAMRYDALLAQRFMRGARLLNREAICTGYRLDAVQRVAAFRADSQRPLAQRLADLEAALRLDSGFIEAQLDLAKARGDTAAVRAIETQSNGSAVNRLELEVVRLLRESPEQALALAEQARETGQVSGGTLVRVYLNVGRPRAALAVIDRLSATDIEAAGGSAVVAAMRASAHFQQGDDAAVLRVLAKPPANEAAFFAMLRLASLAARGDSVAWIAAWDAARPSNPSRVPLLMRSAGAAVVAGHVGLGRALFRRARDAGELLLADADSSAASTLTVADARRFSGDAEGALELLDRVRPGRDTLLALRVETRRALTAMASGNERVARSAIAAVEQLAERRPGWLASLARARLESVRGDLRAAADHLRRAIASGLPRQFNDPTAEHGDLRTDADLARLFATPAGRALMLASE